MDLTVLRDHEDEAIKEIETWARSKQLLIYELLNRRAQLHDEQYRVRPGPGVEERTR